MNAGRLVLVGAVLAGLSYPPFHLILPSLVSLVPLVLSILVGEAESRTPRHHAIQGFWFGAASTAVVLHWMPVALWRYSPLATAGFGLALLVGGGQVALVAGLVAWLRSASRAPLILLFPMLWTASEWLVGRLGNLRFPWLGLGTSLTGYPVLVQLADVAGARGITLMLSAANVALALAWSRRTHAREAWRLVGAVSLGLVVAAGYGWWQLRAPTSGSTRPVAIVQTALGYDESLTTDADSLLGRVIDATRRVVSASHPALVIWPEAALPVPLSRRADWTTRLASLARESQSALLVGTIDSIRAGNGVVERYNAVVLFDSAGRQGSPTYHKQYLVPLFEFMPALIPLVPPPVAREQYLPGVDGPAYRAAGGTFGILICFESAFEGLARRYRDEADFLVNVSNDAWLAGTGGPDQHAAHLVMRAIENRVSVVRVANYGVSGVIDPFGRWKAKTRSSIDSTIVDRVPIGSRRSIYTRVGDWVGWLSVVGTMVAVGFGVLMVRRASA